MHSEIKLLADKNIYLLEHSLPPAVSLTTFNPENGLPNDTCHFDALFVRTVTQINKSTLPDPGKLKLIASSSAGIDHIDTDYLDSQNITFAHAPGNNARSVAEYACTALFLWASKRNKSLKEMSVGIIGAGHVGWSLITLLKNLNLNVYCYDPPRANLDKTFKSCSKEKVLSADILTFHVPLTRNWKYATDKWLNRDILKNNSFELIINTSRGGVVDENAVIDFKKRGRVNDFVFDVWEKEPGFSSESAANAFIATPHIAGYSHQSKWRATCMITKNLCKLFSLSVPDFTFPYRAADAPQPQLHFTGSESLSEVLKSVHPICDYDYKLRQIIDSDLPHKRREFSKLRTEVPFRHEFSEISLPEAILKKYPALLKLGFRSDSE